MKKAVILGASSGIGRSLAELLGAEGYTLLLCARSQKDLDCNARNISLMSGSVVIPFVVDINVKRERDELFAYLDTDFKPDCIFITTGEISDDDNGFQDELVIKSLLDTNLNSLIFFLSSLLRKPSHNRNHKVFILSSVATSRARRNNVVYATSKTAFDFYCQGLQHLFGQDNIQILIFRLGYIDTMMSYGKHLLFPASPPEKAAWAIVNHMESKARIIYYPAFWRLIVNIVKIIPWSIYKKVNF
jgi:hypothetical protein